VVDDPARLLRAMFDAAIASARPEICVPPELPPLPLGRFIVIGAGKASAQMAKAVEEHYAGSIEGLVVTRHGYGAACEKIEIIEAAHPVPDEMSVEAAQRILAKMRGLRPRDTVLCLISGGGSSLMCLPGEGMTLADKQEVNRALLASGAPINEMNVVRRHLSGIKGGRLAAATYPARLITLVISDVPGDSLSDIASGPTVADPTTCADALDIVRRYDISLPVSARVLLETGAGETPKPGDQRLSRAETKVVATPRMALLAAAEAARAAGVTPVLLGDRIEGEARDVGKAMAAIALSCADHGEPARAPCVLLSGGETTVTLPKGKPAEGRGGRNVEFLLALAIALNGAARIHAIAGDTDGVDGVEEIAGALVSPDTLSRALAKGMKPKDALARHDAHTFFQALSDGVVTGPTGTNVNDFRAVLITK
jgi:glycerate 2-kinase